MSSTSAVFIFSIILSRTCLSSVSYGINELSQSEIQKSMSSFSDPYITNIDDNVSCETLQQNIAMVSAKFSVCAVENARPIRLCTNCAGIYEDVMNAHTTLMNSSVLFEGVKCGDLFFKSDRLAVVNMIYHGVLDLWSDAYCNDCYTAGGKTNYSHISPSTEKFFDAWVEVMHCLNSNTTELGKVGNVTCTNCSSVYHKLDFIYDEMRGTSSSPICMDIVDTMNLTRHKWNYEFRCKKFNTAIGYSNIILTVLIALLPVTFYTVARFISAIEVINIVQPKRRTYIPEHN